MKSRILTMALSLVLLPPALSQTFDADGNIIPTGPDRRTAPDPTLYEQQRRNAAVMQGLTAQTLEYQEGHAAAVEYYREREAARQQPIMEGSSRSSGSQSAPRLSREDEAAIANMRSDLQRRGTSASERAALSAEMDRIYSKYTGVMPAAPAPIDPPQPERKVTTGQRVINTPGRIAPIICNTTTIGNQVRENCR